MAGLASHLPKMVKISTKVAYYELAKTFPFLNDSYEGYSLLRPCFLPRFSSRRPRKRAPVSKRQ